MKALGVLDRYVLRRWIGIFLASALGIPAVAVLIHLSDTLGKRAGKLPVSTILLSEAYYYPYQVTLLFPAAILFATVFTLNGLGRNSELTATKAGGISFVRLAMPIFIVAALAVPLNFWMQELTAVSSQRQRLLLEPRGGSLSAKGKVNAAYVSDSGWTYGAGEVLRNIPGKDGENIVGKMQRVLIDGPKDGPTLITITADSALWFPSRKNWTLVAGMEIFIGDSGQTQTVGFRSMVARHLSDPPSVLVDERKKGEEMSYQEFRKYIGQLRRAGTVPGQLEVDLYLKIALPFACLVVALFGAPLAVTNPRAGAALGLALALGTTLVYLTGTQIMKAIGGKGYIQPEYAAWSMNIVFGIIAIILLMRVKS